MCPCTSVTVYNNEAIVKSVTSRLRLERAVGALCVAMLVAGVVLNPASGVCLFVGFFILNIADRCSDE